MFNIKHMYDSHSAMLYKSWMLSYMPGDNISYTTASASVQTDKSLRCPLKDSLDPWLPTKCSAKNSNQIARMRNLIRDVAGRISNLVGNAVLRFLFLGSTVFNPAKVYIHQNFKVVVHVIIIDQWNNAFVRNPGNGY